METLGFLPAKWSVSVNAPLGAHTNVRLDTTSKLAFWSLLGIPQRGALVLGTRLKSWQVCGGVGSQRRLREALRTTYGVTCHYEKDL